MGYAAYFGLEAHLRRTIQLGCATSTICWSFRTDSLYMFVEMFQVWLKKKLKGGWDLLKQQRLYICFVVGLLWQIMKIECKRPCLLLNSTMFQWKFHVLWLWCRLWLGLVMDTCVIEQNSKIWHIDCIR